MERVQWHESLLSWTNGRGVKIRDVSSGHKLAFIQKPTFSPPLSPHVPPASPHLLWLPPSPSSPLTLVVAWGPFIKVAPVSPPKAPGLPRTVHLQAFFSLGEGEGEGEEGKPPPVILGVAPCGPHKLAVVYSGCQAGSGPEAWAVSLAVGPLSGPFPLPLSLPLSPSLNPLSGFRATERARLRGEAPFPTALAWSPSPSPSPLDEAPDVLYFVAVQGQVVRARLR